MDITVVVNLMIELFLILILGYGIAKLNIIDPVTNQKLSSVVVNVAMPALVFASAAQNVNQGDLKEVMLYLGFGFLFYGIMVVLSWILTRCMGTPGDQRGTYQFMLIFSNCSFMGYPVLEAIFGSRAIFLGAIFNLPFNLLAFSYGIFLISKDGEGTAAFQPKKLINPGIIASVLAILIFAIHISLPQIVTQTFATVGNLTTPLSMLVLGASLAEVPIKDIWKEVRVYPMTFFRLLLLPLITFLLMRLVSDDLTLVGIATMTAAMPVASMTVMLSNQYKGKTKLAAIGVFISTLFSVVTIPLVAQIFSLLMSE